MPVDGEHQRRRAVGGGAVERDVVHRAEALERGREQRLLVRADGVEVELEHVLGGGAHAGQPLERQRAQLPAVRRLVGRRVELVRAGTRSGSRGGRTGRRCAGRTTCRRAGDHVGAERREVVAAVRRGVDGVEVHARADAMGGGDDPLEVGHRADGVGGGGHRDPARALGQHGLDGASRAARACPARARRSARSRRRARPRSPTGARWSRGPDACRRSRRPGRARARRWPRSASSVAVKLGPKKMPSGSPPSSVAQAARVLVDQLVGLVRVLERAAVVGHAARAHPVGHRLDHAVDAPGCRRRRQGAPSRRAGRGNGRGSQRASRGQFGVVRVGEQLGGVGGLRSSAARRPRRWRRTRRRRRPPSASSGRPWRGPCGRCRRSASSSCAELAAQPGLFPDLAQRALLPASRPGRACPWAATSRRSGAVHDRDRAVVAADHAARGLDLCLLGVHAARILADAAGSGRMSGDGYGWQRLHSAASVGCSSRSLSRRCAAGHGGCRCADRRAARWNGARAAGRGRHRRGDRHAAGGSRGSTAR